MGIEAGVETTRASRCCSAAHMRSSMKGTRMSMFHDIRRIFSELIGVEMTGSGDSRPDISAQSEPLWRQYDCSRGL